MKNVRNRLKNEVFEKDLGRKSIKQQSKLNFSGTRKSCTSYDSCTFGQNEFLVEQPIHLGFEVFELS